MEYKYDFLVIGSGLAGLSCALKVAKYGKVCIVTKSSISDSNTVLAQGGIAAVMYDEEDKNKHVEDTLIAGSRLNNEKIVNIVVDEAKSQIDDLVKWGTNFDTTPDGKFDLVREGGHSEKRILHHKDDTGREIENALSKQVLANENIEVLENWFALDLITQHHMGELVKRSRTDVECYGIYALNMNDNSVHTILAKSTLMATGGIGNVYQTTTNPLIATGDGVAMVYRAKGQVENMEFVQFHPTSLYNPKEHPSFLITEAMRGFGGVLRNHKGDKFMNRYDSRASLAPRDIVARAIDNEMKIYGIDHVYLDCSHLNADELKDHFPNIYDKCLSIGIDITKDQIPVVPAAHYLCGGVVVDEYGRTSVKNLYAAGEVACTGLHGANRLASNSLLEALVFSNRAAKDIVKILPSLKLKEAIPIWNDEGTSFPEEMILITQNKLELQQIMSNYVGIVRSNLRLKRALTRLQIIYDETETLYKKTTVSRELCELRNAINVGYLVIKMAEKRKASIGLHYNVDYS